MPRGPAKTPFLLATVRCTALRGRRRDRGCPALAAVILTHSGWWRIMAVFCLGGMCAFGSITRRSMGVRTVRCTASAGCVRRRCGLIVATPFETPDAACLKGFKQLLSSESAVSPESSKVQHKSCGFVTCMHQQTSGVPCVCNLLTGLVKTNMPHTRYFSLVEWKS
jgi:hypothetical protein